MINTRSSDIKKSCAFPGVAQFSISLLAFCLYFSSSNAQCPDNIDFETGTFKNWTCYTGSVSALGGRNVIDLFRSSGPAFNQHTMYSRLNPQRDPYGGFPVNCPNGSGHSIRLGNDQAGGQAEGISYEFMIPSNRDNYSLIYHYAVVFQDPNHQEFQQPRLEIEVVNVTDNQVLHCSSFTFVPFGSLLPGFFISPFQVDTTDVWCKDWSAVSINLNGNAGKTVRLSFKTADCTFVRHFGYAYIDVNTECSSEFIGATYCPDDTAINVTAPWGYQNYNWYDNNFTRQLGTNQSIRFAPPPVSGTTIAVQVVPFDGYGCEDTLYARLIDTLTITANAGRDTISCNQDLVAIGVNPIPGLIYKWNPPDGLSDPNTANPRAGPAVTTSYVLTVNNFGGGCVNTDTIVVTASIIDSNLSVLGKDAYCIGSGDSAILIVQPSASIQWFKDGVAINGANNARYRVTQSGIYHALIFNDLGCSIETTQKDILIEQPTPGITYPVEYMVVDYPHQLQARMFGIGAEWSPSTFLSDATTYTPTFNGPTDFLYTVAIKTRAGCVTVDTQMVKITKEVKIHVPTAFTPNNDGLNDYFKPIPMGFKEIKYFRIFNRWGQLIFDLRSDPRGWDGTIGGKPQGSQVFVWIAEAVGVDNKLYNEKGTFTLVR